MNLEPRHGYFLLLPRPEPRIYVYCDLNLRAILSFYHLELPVFGGDVVILFLLLELTDVVDGFLELEDLLLEG